MLKKCSKYQKSFECKESNACWCNKIEHISILLKQNLSKREEKIIRFLKVRVCS